MSIPVTSGLVLHLDAQQITGVSDGDPVGTWEDQSTSELDYEGNTVDVTYDANGINTGRPGVRCGVDEDAFLTAVSSALSVSADASITVFVVWRPVAWNGSNPGFFRSGSSSSGSDFFIFQGSTGRPWVRWGGSDILEPGSGYGVPLDLPSVLTWRISDEDAADFYANGALEHTDTHAQSTGGFTVNNLGRQISQERPEAFYGEIIFYNRALSDMERESVEAYLTDRWTDPPQLHIAAVRSSRFLARFTEEMADPTGEHGAFSFTVDGGSSRSFDSAELSNEGDGIWLAFSGDAVPAGATVTLSYDAGTGGVESVFGGALASFTDEEVTTLPAWHRGGQKAASGDSNSQTVDRPDDVAEGDLLVAVWEVRQGDLAAADFTPPAGWSAIHVETTEGISSSPSVGAWMKVATGSEPADYTFQFTGSAIENAIVIGRVTGFDESNPIEDATGSNTGGGGGTSHTTPGLTGIADHTYLRIAAASGRVGSGTPGEVSVQSPDGFLQIDADQQGGFSGAVEDEYVAGTAAPDVDWGTENLRWAALFFLVRAEGGESVAPTLESATTNEAGTEIEPTFSEDMADPTGEHAAFSYKINGGSAQSISAIVPKGGDATSFVATLDGDLPEFGDTVTLSYDDTTGSVQSAAGVDLASFTDEAVTNAVPEPVVPGTNRLTDATLRALISGGDGTTRVTQTSVRVLIEHSPPDAPTLSGTIDGTTLNLQTTDFSPGAPGDSHVETLYQVQEAGGDWSSPLIDDATEDFLLTLVYGADDGIPEETEIEARAAHVSESGASAWSNILELETGLTTPRPDKPTVTEDDHGFDYVAASISDFVHSEGVTTVEDWDADDNDLPFPIAAQIRVVRTSDDAVVADTGLSSVVADTQEALLEDLDDDESYVLEGRWQDGKYGATSPWSDPVAFSTDEIPPVRPDTPTITLVNCGGNAAELSGDAFSHDEGGAEHVETQWRACLLMDGAEEAGSCGTVLTTDAAELTAFTFEGLEGVEEGTYVFDVRYRDQLGRWSDWSNTVSCSVLPDAPSPTFASPTAGLATDEDQTVEWDMPTVPDAVWTFDGEYKRDGAAEWTEWFDGITDETQELTISGLVNGLYWLRVRACWPAEDGGACGEWAYLPIEIDRTGMASVTYDFRGMEELPATWEEIWDDSEDGVSWELREEASCGHGGLLARHSDRRGAFLAFTELGKPTKLRMTTTLAFLANDQVWWGWRYAYGGWLTGGTGYRGLSAADTGEFQSGWAQLVSPGGGAWPFPPPTTRCGDDSPQPCCACGFVQCGICAGSAPITRSRRVAKGEANGQLVEYAVPSRRGSIRGRLYRPARGHPVGGDTAEVLEEEGELQRGMEYATHRCGADCDHAACEWRPVFYTQITEAERLASGLYRVRSKVVGPGLDPDQGWSYDEDLQLHDLGLFQDDEVACGYCGLTFHHTGNLTGDVGMLFQSVSVTLPEGFITSGPTLGTATTRPARS